jgi:hypothetical protein
MNQNELREYLFQKDLEQEKEMDKLIRDAQPKKVNEDYKLRLYKPPIITRDLIGPDYIAEKQLMDLSLDLQLQNMVKQANYAVSDKKPEAMKSSVTEEMIADYKKEVMKPVQIGNKFHLYRPVELPPLIRPKDLPYNHKGPKITETEYERDSQIIFADIKTFEAELERAQKEKKILEDNFSLTSSTMFNEPARIAELQTLSRDELIKALKQKKSSLTDDKLIEKIIAKEKVGKLLPTDLNPIKTDLGNKEAEILHYVGEIKGANKAFRRLKTDFDQQADIDEENRLKTMEFENKKRQVAQEALSDFNRLNQGKIEVARQSNETDDEFLARLQNMGNIFVDPADMEKQIITEILNKAKKNILELTDDYGRAESVTRMLNNKERFQMNKLFPMIKKEYSEKFGLNNKNLDDVEITQFIKNKIDTGQALITATTIPAITKTDPEAQEATPVEAAVVPKVETKISVVGLKLYTKRVMTEYPEYNLKILRTKPQLINQLVDKQLWNEKDIYDYLRYLRNNPDVSYLDEAQVAQPINTPYETPEEEEFRRVALATKQFQDANLGSKTPEELEFEKAQRELSGVGLKNHVLPSTVPFGKIALDLNKLFYQNVLSIKRHNGNKIIGHKNKRVSDNFVDIIMKMFENKTITQSDLKNIKDEQMLYDNLIVQSGLHKLKKIPTNIEQTSEQMKNRLGLITGEIEAGNSNKALLSELHELLFKMVRVHLISKNAAAAYYKNIKDTFFTL